MRDRTDSPGPRMRAGSDFLPPDARSTGVFGGFWLLLFLAGFLVSGPWAGFHGVLLAGVALLIGFRPPQVALPRHWWLLAAAFVAFGSSAFLPADWFAMPAWREHLRELGVQTGSQVVIQARQAAEMLAMFTVMLLTGLWLAGHRASPSQLRRWTLVFAIGVATYAIVSRALQTWLQTELGAGGSHFGFFPNRNHSATYLAMGAMCGLGCVVQAIRDKRFVAMGAALAATGVCLWAVAAWSISRAGVVLVGLGFLIWLPILGRRYLGRHGLWAIGLMALTAVGLFFIADSGVKERLAKTVEKASAVINQEDLMTPGEGKPALESTEDLDLRIPIALDTLDLIRDFKWTGIGGGQFYHVFPQYKNRSTDANDADCYHPESDWLWMAAEAGIPATLAVAALLILALRKSQLAIVRGKDRALRSACLVAALMVPIHGIFDVPGHRITLAWSAALLYALSMPSLPLEKPVGPPRAWPFRLAALAIMAAAAFLIRAQWFGGPRPALAAASGAIAEARRLYQEDRTLQQAAETQGRIYQPDPSEDRLEKGLTLIDQAKPVTPLDRDLLRYEAFLAFHFDDKYDRIDSAFAIDRALDPTWVAGPLRQAAAWSEMDPQRTAALWEEALRRARNLDRLQPGTHQSEERILREIQRFAKGRPALEGVVPAAN